MASLMYSLGFILYKFPVQLPHSHHQPAAHFKMQPALFVPADNALPPE